MSEPNESKPTTRTSLAEHLVAIIVTAIILEQHSRLPEAKFPVLVICCVIVAVLGVKYFSRLAKHLRRRIRPYDSTSLTIANWFILPVAIALMLSSAATHWPAKMRFHLSKPSFETLVETASTGDELTGFPRRVGLYWIDYVKDGGFNRETGEGTIGFITGAALIDECGFLYDKANPKDSHWLTTKVAPCWYLTEW